MSVSIEKTSDNIAPSPATTRPPEFYTLRLDSGHLRLRNWSTWLLLAVLRACAPLPLRVSRAVGALLGWSFFLVNGKRRRIARVNLRLCFPELVARQRRSLLRRHFVMTGKSYADLGFLAWAAPARIERKIRVLGVEHLRTAQQRGGRVILLVPHCLGVNFGSIIAKHCPVFSMFKPPRDALLNWFINKGRMRFGASLLTRRQGMRPVLRALRQGMAFYYIPDEDFGPERSVFAPFFGIQTATLPTLARLAAIADAAVIPLFVRMLPGGEGYEMSLSAPLQDFPSDDPVRDAARMNRVLEASIREVPEQYMWTLKLFKTRPGNVASPYR
jgi:Kdo2-lipid IVA lauroyltransferase/acyltransferase